jgi:FixJ family two-component response regulator
MTDERLSCRAQNRIQYELGWELLTPRERSHGAGRRRQDEQRDWRNAGVSHRTVELQRTRVMEKMQAKSLADLVGMALAYSGH